MRKIDKIILHCSDSSFGNAEMIDEWHKERGFDEIGYHYVIKNGYMVDPIKKDSYKAKEDGLLEGGRDDRLEGAHCYGYNKTSIGICLIGKHLFSTAQMFNTLPTLLTDLCREYDLKVEDIYGHTELNGNKTCPNIDMEMLRGYLKEGGMQ